MTKFICAFEVIRHLLPELPPLGSYDESQEQEEEKEPKPVVKTIVNKDGTHVTVHRRKNPFRPLPSFASFKESS